MRNDNGWNMGTISYKSMIGNMWLVIILTNIIWIIVTFSFACSIRFNKKLIDSHKNYTSGVWTKVRILEERDNILAEAMGGSFIKTTITDSNGWIKEDIRFQKFGEEK